MHVVFIVTPWGEPG